MPTGYGAIFNDGVKYLKINKFDANGTDKSDYLAQMTSIRINHGDIGIKQYVISTTQVQNNYFIFGLTYPQPVTSSIGDINNYSFQATTTTLDGYNTFFYSKCENNIVSLKQYEILYLKAIKSTLYYGLLKQCL
jgi:hypothetical protein